MCFVVIFWGIFVWIGLYYDLNICLKPILSRAEILDSDLWESLNQLTGIAVNVFTFFLLTEQKLSNVPGVGFIRTTQRFSLFWWGNYYYWTISSWKPLWCSSGCLTWAKLIKIAASRGCCRIACSRLCRVLSRLWSDRDSRRQSIWGQCASYMYFMWRFLSALTYTGNMHLH